MIIRLLYLFSLIFYVSAAGEFTVLSQPPSAVFKGHDYLKQSILKEVYSAVLGYTTEQDSNWQGLYLTDPFGLAKCIATVSVDGIADIEPVKGHIYALITDENEDTTFKQMDMRVQERLLVDESNLVIRVDLSHGLSEIQDIEFLSGIKNIKPDKPLRGILKLSMDQDRQFLEELAFLSAITNKINSVGEKEMLPKVFWVKLGSLRALSDLYGANSTETKEAKRLLNEGLDAFNRAFVKLFKGDVLVNVVTNDFSSSRRVRRAAPKEDEKEETNKRNLALNYSSNYPVIFNIMLWFGIAMIFSLFAICLFISNMDPGRDSIYRMTSTRFKKDN